MTDVIRVLHVDDSLFDRELVHDALMVTHEGFALTAAATREEFFQCMEQGPYDLVLSDFNILGFEGLQVIEEVQRRCPDLPVIIVTGTGTEEIAVNALKQGASDYVIKTPRHIVHLPFTIKAVMERIRLLQQQRQQQDELQTAHQRLDMVVRMSPAAMIAMDRHKRVILWNPAAQRMFQWSPAEVIGRGLPIVPEEEGVEFEERWAKILEGQSYRNVEMQRMCKDGSRVYVMASIAPLMATEGKVEGGFGVFLDITQRYEAERQLAESEAQLHQLARHMSLVREDEKKRLARELHDHLGQQLTVIKLGLNEMESDLAQDNALLYQKLQGVLGLVDDTINTVRQTSIDLRPGTLDLNGLGAAIQDEAEKAERLGGLTVDLHCDINPRSLDESLTIDLYRLVQESLTNVVRHAQATEVKLTVKQWDQKIHLQVLDNGVGISAGESIQNNSPGLLGMRERVRAHRGICQIGPGSQGGTLVTIEIPLAAPNTISA